MAIVLGSGNDNFYIYEGFLGGTSDATLTDVNLQTIDGGAGSDTVVLGDTYPNENFTLTVSDVGVVTLTAASGHTTFQNFETFRYSNKIVLAVGSSGNDQVNGGSASDVGLYGLAGNDTLNGGAGADVMLGGAGNDTYVVDNALDSVHETTVKGGSVDAGGLDTVQSSIAWTLGSLLENLALTGSAAINGTGNTLANKLTGNSAANALAGGAGSDLLNGGGGSDLLSGGGGADRFQFSTPLGAGNVDTISDWGAGGKADHFLLDDDIFAALGPVTATTKLAAAMFFNGTAAHDASDRIVYDQASGSLYYDPDGTGAAAQVLFAHVGDTTHPTLGAGAFLIVV